MRAAQQKMSKCPAGGGGGRGRQGRGPAWRFLDSRSPGFDPGRWSLAPDSERSASHLSTPAGNQEDVPGAGPESLQQGWEARSDRFDVRGWGPARPPRGASKRAAFRPVRASDLARTLRAPGGRAAESHSPLAQGMERKRPSRRSRPPPPRDRRYCARKGSGGTAPAAGDLARPRACFLSGPRGARVAGSKKEERENKPKWEKSDGPVPIVRPLVQAGPESPAPPPRRPRFLSLSAFLSPLWHFSLAFQAWLFRALSSGQTDPLGGSSLLSSLPPGLTVRMKLSKVIKHLHPSLSLFSWGTRGRGGGGPK